MECILRVFFCMLTFKLKCVSGTPWFLWSSPSDCAFTSKGEGPIPGWWTRIPQAAVGVEGGGAGNLVTKSNAD